jgi:two-component system sensor histidine kinase UhpB
MVYHWSERNPELKFLLNCGAEVDSVEKSVSIQVFRVIQECLTNVVRHAHAQQVSIEVQKLDHPLSCLQLKIVDDGQGCDLNAVHHGFGLLGIKERVKSLGGELTICTQAGAGMQVTAQIPVL